MPQNDVACASQRGKASWLDRGGGAAAAARSSLPLPPTTFFSLSGLFCTDWMRKRGGDGRRAGGARGRRKQWPPGRRRPAFGSLECVPPIGKGRFRKVLKSNPQIESTYYVAMLEEAEAVCLTI